jgi:hypothetical protein
MSPALGSCALLLVFAIAASTLIRTAKRSSDKRARKSPTTRAGCRDIPASKPFRGRIRTAGQSLGLPGSDRHAPSGFLPGQRDHARPASPRRGRRRGRRDILLGRGWEIRNAGYRPTGWRRRPGQRGVWFVSGERIRNRARLIRYAGWRNSLALFEYNVPLAKSVYRFRGNGVEKTLAFHGAFSVDPADGDPRQLVVETEQFAQRDTACRIEHTMNYRRVKIGSGDFLLPEVSTMDGLYRSGAESLNETPDWPEQAHRHRDGGRG